MPGVFSLVQATLGGGVYAIQPPIGEDWEVTELGSSAIVGVPPAGVPNVVAGVFSTAVGVNSFLVNSSLANPHIRGWIAPKMWSINNANYIQLINPEAGPLNLAAVVRKERRYGPNETSSSITGSATVIAGQVTAIRPPVGEDWCITDIGSSRWVGAQPAGLPNVTVNITDGVNAALVFDGAAPRGWFKPMEIYINNANYITITNPAGAGATISWTGYKSRRYSPTGNSGVVSDVVVLGAGGVAVIQPPVGYEMKVTEIGCSVWLPGPPALPSILVSLSNGVIAPVLQDGINNKGWDANMAYYLSRGTFMTLTDAGAGSTIGYSAHIWRAQ